METLSAGGSKETDHTAAKNTDFVFVLDGQVLEIPYFNKTETNREEGVKKEK